MKKTILETARLKVQIVQEEDIEPLYKDCFSDKEVMKLLLGRTFTLKETKAYVEANFSKGSILDFCVAFTKVSNELIGYIGMFTYGYNNREDEYEFGYILKQEAWGKGYATELSLGQIKKLKESFPSCTIWATAHPENMASKKVLKKVKMTCVEEQITMPKRGLRDVYKLT
ncbi:MAG: GNAT family N-acetyltransferase [uncultured Sulfurovum sp.]|uniref:GNAT family N-acetyltransferase n=1 Tax=uncultured Sulfurovum sp. TaxID=269237 RepID=A0A6S6S1U0_9BACT|nr:MAG: GNAT family N-acetyltransferase [uncultured Sulfurovum sp.]